MNKVSKASYELQQKTKLIKSEKINCVFLAVELHCRSQSISNNVHENFVIAIIIIISQNQNTHKS